MTAEPDLELHRALVRIELHDAMRLLHVRSDATLNARVFRDRLTVRSYGYTVTRSPEQEQAARRIRGLLAVQQSST